MAIYCRVSTNDQSCERQERDLLAYAQRANFEVVGIFKEIASGVKVLADKGVYTIDGAAGTEKTPGVPFNGSKFAADNFKDEGKTAAQLATIAKADLKAPDAFASKDVYPVQSFSVQSFVILRRFFVIPA